MTKPIPQEPKFIQSATATQKLLAGIAVSLFFTVLITGWSYVADFFKPDFTETLRHTRLWLALIGIVITGFVGIKQIRSMADWIIDNWELYKKLSENIKKGKEE